jgi:hypothetical protein
MKHWVPSIERAAVALPMQAAAQPRPARSEARLPSMVGLLISVGLLAGLAWALAPTSPVASEVRD